MSIMWTIAKREFRSYFDSPIAYVVVCVSFLGLGLLIFFGQGGYWQTDRATLSPLFFFLPAVSLLIVPVITMRLMAEERRSGTLEMLITLPVKDSDVILGKYLGALGLMLVLFLFTLLYPIMMFKFPWNLGPLDWGQIASGYVGLVLFAAASVGLGLLISSLTDSQAVAFFLTLALLALLWFSGTFAQYIEGDASGLVSFISFQSRLEGFQRGLIDSRDTVYFLSIAALSLIVSFRVLERRKWA